MSIKRVEIISKEGIFMRIAVITGASMGLGREFARQIPKCYRSLDEIWLIARNTDKL